MNSTGKSPSKEIRKCLIALADQDPAYANFTCKIIPNIDPASVLGVRTPAIRKLAKDLIKEYGIGSPELSNFFADLPHKYYEENQLHMSLMALIKDFNLAITETERFLPYIDNWSTCDSVLSPSFKEHREDLISHIDAWLESDRIYTMRFGIGVLMRFFLDDSYFKEGYLAKVADIRSDEYYLNMMIAWYFATALAKQWDYAIKYIEGNKLDLFTHNKAIQKAVESYRISPNQKAYLKKLKLKCN